MDDFDKMVAEKVATLKDKIKVELDKSPEAIKLKIPFYVPIRHDRLYNDFKKTVTSQMSKEGYEMSDFLPEYEILAYGIMRYVLITKIK
jgi:hypothetical protein